MLALAFTLWIHATVNGSGLVALGDSNISDATLAKAAAVKGGPLTLRLVPTCGLQMLTRIGRAPAGLEISPAVNPTQATWNDPMNGYSRACRVNLRPFVVGLKPGTYDISLTFIESRQGPNGHVPNDTHRVRFTRDADPMIPRMSTPRPPSPARPQ